MSEFPNGSHPAGVDTAPGDERLDGSGVAQGVRGYLIGLIIASGLTVASFAIAQGHVVWAGGVPAALTALAIAQMGVHLVFFLHLTTGPDNINNALALAFGVLIVVLIIGGSVWIMYDMNHLMAPMKPVAGMPG